MLVLLVSTPAPTLYVGKFGKTRISIPEPDIGVNGTLLASPGYAQRLLSRYRLLQSHGPVLH